MVEVRVELRNGGLEAFAVIDSAESPIDVVAVAGLVLERLRQGGVTTPVDEASVRRALEAGFRGPAPCTCEVLIAKGRSPETGIGAQILPFFSVRDTPLGKDTDPFSAFAQNTTYPGDVILRKTPPSEGIPGRSLLGDPIPARPGADIRIVSGEHVEEEDGVLFRSSSYGVVLFHEGHLRVLEALRISDDRLQAWMTVFPDARIDEDVQVQKLLSALEILGVREGADRQAIAGAVREARVSRSPVVDVLVAQGRMPVDGREADYRLVVDLEKKAFKVVEGDRIDFREMDTVRNVSKGEALAHRVPGTEPVPGFRVDGTTLKPSHQRAQGLKPGDNTVVSEDGQQVLADADGMVVIREGKFHVVDQYLVPGDVDFATGNIRASGAVRIRGQVNSGFLVEAGKDADIQGDGWGAEVTAGGQVRIRGALAAGSRVTAGKSLVARYILNSRVEVGGDLEVALSITGSEVYVKGKIRAMGAQGAILGGEVNAALGIEARTIGAPSARTRVAVGVDLRVHREIEGLQKEAAALAAEIGALQQTLGRDFLKDPRVALLALPPALRKGKIEVLRKMQEIHKREAEVAARREVLAKLVVEGRDAHIAVAGEIHSGTFVIIGQAQITLTETIRHAVLCYSPEEHRVVWRRM